MYSGHGRTGGHYETKGGTAACQESEEGGGSCCCCSRATLMTLMVARGIGVGDRRCPRCWTGHGSFEMLRLLFFSGVEEGEEGHECFIGEVMKQKACVRGFLCERMRQGRKLG